ncbi:N(4)-(Beta-N-acetylglucosaminyl)-L-asparaginase-like [Gracilinanus agilis]|uniref:N(4)-(Beta-N-acetylglucosaminyl)-L-asparaginase- like n=1 Tax=Gracilinanus agilis TaxID=191870 RepID=UPI001CFC742D|nr:N(4)-(Beta-N-acetylglucosaminyl)-L-asparaginase-like [Gracilinanus agilis]
MAAAAVGTWAFSLPAVQKLKSLLKNGVGATDSLQEVIADIEDSEETGQYIIGRGGYPNKNGQVQCDAAIMEGFPGRFGAVAALHGIGTPIVVARKVMDKSIHSFLVGEGALAFAREEGFMEEENECMLSQQSAEAYREYLGKKPNFHGHDTLGLIALDIYGNITVGVSTSGAPFKYPGRVGDSPLPGCGLYADCQVGAAAATGEGDKIMCFCPCFHVVLLMKQLADSPSCHVSLMTSPRPLRFNQSARGSQSGAFSRETVGRGEEREGKWGKVGWSTAPSMRMLRGRRARRESESQRPCQTIWLRGPPARAWTILPSMQCGAAALWAV